MASASVRFYVVPEEHEQIPLCYDSNPSSPHVSSQSRITVALPYIFHHKLLHQGLHRGWRAALNLTLAEAECTDCCFNKLFFFFFFAVSSMVYFFSIWAWKIDIICGQSSDFIHKLEQFEFVLWVLLPANMLNWPLQSFSGDEHSPSRGR